MSTPPPVNTEVPPGMPEFGPTGRRIVYKDGKPCRSCNSLLDFKMAMPGKPSPPVAASKETSATVVAATAVAATAAAASGPSPAKDCPPDVNLLGRSSWTLLHSIAAAYPTTPTPAQQDDARTFISVFSRLYPCWFCAEDFRAYVEVNKVQVKSLEEFGQWMCNAHNAVNRKLGKKEFPCNLWLQRWKDGWSDGSCD